MVVRNGEMVFACSRWRCVATNNTRLMPRERGSSFQAVGRTLKGGAETPATGAVQP